MKDFEKFDLNEPHETTASGNTSDKPKEKEESDLKLKPTDAGYKWFTCPTCDGLGQVSQDKDKELSSLRDALRQRDEMIKELAKGIDRAILNMEINVPSVQRKGYSEWVDCGVELKSLIKKANSLT